MEIQEFKHYFLVNGIKIHWNFKLLPKGFEAITLFGHVFDVQSKQNLKKYLETYYGREMVNHERIHMMQAKSFKLGYFSFYIVYLAWWIKGLFYNKFNNFEAYHSIPFEKEAFHDERDFNYNEVNWKKFKL